MERNLARSFYEEETTRTQAYLKATEVYKTRVNHFLSWHPWKAMNVCPDYETREATLEEVLDSINTVKLKDNAEVT